jgi:hypothetical protein
MRWLLRGHRVVLGICAASVVSLASLAAVQYVDGSSATKSRVLGEKLLGSGTNSSPLNSQSNANKPNGNSGNPGNSGNAGNGNNGVVPEAKSFSIAVDHQEDSLGPGSKAKIYLSITNTSQQTIRVDQLSASLVSIQSTTGSSDACTATNSGLQIDPWTGESFDVLQGHTVSSAPGYIPIEFGTTAPDSCQSAIINLKFTGSAVKA